MAHIEKYTISAIGHMTNHYGRSDVGEKASYIVRRNKNIDTERTHLNYNLASDIQPLSQVDFIHRRISEVKCLKRKDVNVLCDWVVTAPKTLPENEQERFFKSVYNFLANKYGKENVVSAYVHMDETQPHIHFAFIPICVEKKIDKKTGVEYEIEKVNAKKVITQRELKMFHPELQKAVERDLGHTVDIINGATIDGNKSVEQLKKISALEKKEKKLSQTVESQYKTISNNKSIISSQEYKKANLSRLIPKSIDELSYIEDVILPKLPDNIYDELLEASELVDEYNEVSNDYDRVMIKCETLEYFATGKLNNQSNYDYVRSAYNACDEVNELIDKHDIDLNLVYTETNEPVTHIENDMNWQNALQIAERVKEWFENKLEQIKNFFYSLANRNIETLNVEIDSKNTEIQKNNDTSDINDDSNY